LYFQVRLKRFLEMRGADGGPWRMICALPALWVGLIYEPQAQREALELISSWTQDDRDYLREGAPRLRVWGLGFVLNPMTGFSHRFSVRRWN
jgi:glutamate--cysteine ligase